MYTQCPDCTSVFEISPEHLGAASGMVQCGVCDTTFNALRRLTSTAPGDSTDGENQPDPDHSDRGDKRVKIGDADDVASRQADPIDGDSDTIAPNEFSAGDDTSKVKSLEAAERDVGSAEEAPSGEVRDSDEADAPAQSDDSNEDATTATPDEAKSAGADEETDDPHLQEQPSDTGKNDSETKNADDFFNTSQVLDGWDIEEGENDLEALLADESLLEDIEHGEDVELDETEPESLDEDPDSYSEDTVADPDGHDPDAAAQSHDEAGAPDEAGKDESGDTSEPESESEGVAPQETDSAPESDDESQDSADAGPDAVNDLEDAPESEPGHDREDVTDADAEDERRDTDARPDSEDDLVDDADTDTQKEPEDESDAAPDHEDELEDEPDAGSDSDEELVEESDAESDSDEELGEESDAESDSEDKLKDRSDTDSRDDSEDRLDEDPDAKDDHERETDDNADNDPEPDEHSESDSDEVKTTDDEGLDDSAAGVKGKNGQSDSGNEQADSAALLTEGVDGKFEDDYDDDPDDLKDLGQYLSPGKSMARRIGEGALALGLLLVLAGQYIHYNRAELATHPKAGTHVRHLYSAIGQELKANWKVGDYRVARHTIVPSDDDDTVLLARATVVNNSDSDRPLPLIRLLLKNRWGDTIFGRVFTPDEYLVDPRPDTLTGNGRLEISLDLVHPAPGEEIGYSFGVCLDTPEGPDCGSPAVFNE